MRKILLLIVLIMSSVTVYSNDIGEDKGNTITGHIIEEGTEDNLPFASVFIEETKQGCVADAEGKFRFEKLRKGKYTLRVKLLGYKTKEMKVEVSDDYNVDLHFVMEAETIMADEVVVSANRNEVSRKDAPVVVSVLNKKLFDLVNTTDLAKSLNYQSGLRVENNCQNCGFPAGKN